MTRQCPSCGGWCGYTKANGCNYANAPLQQDLNDMISRNGELEQQMQGLSNEIDGFCITIERQRREYNDLVDKVLADTGFDHIEDYLAWRKARVVGAKP